jgi:hypothetical protein
MEQKAKTNTPKFTHDKLKGLKGRNSPTLKMKKLNVPNVKKHVLIEE